MQKAYITALYDLMKADERVVSLLSDSGTDYDELMAREMPEQCFNFGISEQNQVAVAAGMALCGKIPFVYSTGAFLSYRAAEFIRDDVCFQNANVKIVGMGSGLCWSTLGATHHTLEDIAYLRALPNLTLLSPATPNELRVCVKNAYDIDGPVYIRMGMSGEQEFFDSDADGNLGEIAEVKSGNDIVIFATGSIAGEALSAARQLEAAGISVCVVDVCCLKPLAADKILQFGNGAKAVFTVEEHNMIGGLGTAVAEALLALRRPIRLCKIGVNDSFAHGYGTHIEVLTANGLDADSISAKISAFLKE